TVSELLRALSQSFVVRAGAAGLGREARRVLHVRWPGEAVGPVGSGDLVVFTADERRSEYDESAERSLTALLNSGVSGVLTDTEPDAAAVRAADQACSPLLSSVGRIEQPEQL